MTSARWTRARRATVIAGVALVLGPAPALAHVYVGNGGPAAGFIHPLTGFDHLLAMYTVGLLSAVIGGRAIWTVPGAFVLAMVAGGMLGIAHLALPGVDVGIALSVLLLGAAVAIGPTVPVYGALLAAAVFGACHGYAHGTEMPRVSSPPLYVVGFVAATAGLHVLGAVSGLLVQCRPGAVPRLRIGGALIATAGVGLLFRLV